MIIHTHAHIPLRKAGIELEEIASLHALIAATVMSCLLGSSPCQQKQKKKRPKIRKKKGREYNTHVGRSRHPSPRTRASLERMTLCYLHSLQPLP